MKRMMKMLGLAAVAAMALTALLGAGSASASELCSTNTSPCGGTKYLKGTKVEATSTEAVLTTSGGFVNPVVTCKESEAVGKTTSDGGEGVAVEGTLTTLTFAKCTNSLDGEACTAVSTHKPYNTSAVATTNGNGTMTVTGSGKGNPGGTFNCPTLSVEECSYGAAEVVLDVTGGNPNAKVVASKEALAREAPSDFGCPPNATWTATYTVLKPAPLFLVNP